MIKLPKIKGIIDRRILINYKIEVEYLIDYLPKPFEPIEIEGYGIAGICLIRLKNIRPSMLPSFVGINSENGAHRIAVKWKEGNEYKEGVYIPRRDTSSKLNALVGGRIFPGEHHFSQFNVVEEKEKYDVEIKNEDGTYLRILANKTNEYPKSSLFNNLESVSEFFEKGSIGYSPNKKNYFDCLELKTYSWKVQPLNVISVTSSFFDDENIFPKNSVNFDNALLMENIEHEWNMKEGKSAGHNNV